VIVKLHWAQAAASSRRWSGWGAKLRLVRESSQLLHLQQVEDALGFEDAVLLQQEVGEEAVVGGDGVGEGLLEVGARPLMSPRMASRTSTLALRKIMASSGWSRSLRSLPMLLRQVGFFGAGT
jgi:hypothetical protein